MPLAIALASLGSPTLAGSAPSADSAKPADAASAEGQVRSRAKGAAGAGFLAILNSAVQMQSPLPVPAAGPLPATTTAQTVAGAAVPGPDALKANEANANAAPGVARSLAAQDSAANPAANAVPKSSIAAAQDTTPKATLPPETAQGAAAAAADAASRATLQAAAQAAAARTSTVFGAAADAHGEKNTPTAGPASAMRAAVTVEPATAPQTTNQGVSGARAPSPSAKIQKADSPAQGASSTPSSPSGAGIQNGDGAANAQAATFTQLSGAGSSARPATTAEQVAAAMISHAETTTTSGRTDFHLQLDPPGLGSVSVHMSATASGISAHLVVHDDTARQLIQQNLHSLRQKLVDSGVSLGNLNVSRGDSGAKDSRPQQQPSQTSTPSVPTPRPIQATGLVSSGTSGTAGRIDVVV